MQARHTLRLVALCITMGLCSHVALAHGDFKCNEPSKEWKLREDLSDKLQADGWDVRKVKIDNGCYEVYGFDGKGKRRESYFNPRTLELIGDALQK